jgi:hypothetical protein
MRRRQSELPARTAQESESGVQAYVECQATHRGSERYLLYLGKLVAGEGELLASLNFGFEFSKELRRHHLCRALDHALTDAGNRSADLHLA